MPARFKRIFVIASSIFGLALFLIFAFLAVFVYLNSPPGLPDALKGDAPEGEGLTVTGIIEGDHSPPKTTVIFEVRRGESARSVGQRLVDSGLIRSGILWSLLCRIGREPIKSGSFLIEVPANQLAIHKVLVSGRQMLLRVTVPEGFTIRKTAALMEEMNVCPADEFLAAAADPAITALYRIPGASMEGYLFPDTYLFPPAYPAERAVRAMADNFFSRIVEIGETMAAMQPEELNNLVILASIVEREYRLNEEAPLMAGVFANRLGIGMALQSCATVEYVITEIQGRPHPEILTTRDTEIRDPYNTYIRPGLPPGPICAPGRVALKAALFPAESDYLYFRLIDQASGKHYFSRTFDDHIRAGGLYVKGLP